MDKGGADLIADGRIKVRSGVSPQKFTDRCIVLSDGSELEADVVIFAFVHLPFFLGTCVLILGTLHSTGYVNMREVNAELFGEEVIGKTDEVYGLDAEGEIKGSYRPSGHPGVRCVFTLP